MPDFILGFDSASFDRLVEASRRPWQPRWDIAPDRRCAHV
jgi:hypothetical protein